MKQRKSKLLSVIKFMAFITSFILLANTVLAQQITLGNQKTIGGDYKDFGVAIKKINNGYIAVMASASNISYDRTVALQGQEDYWLVGLDNNLSIKWQKSFGGNSGQFVKDVFVNENNDIIIVGLSDSPISGNKTVANYGNTDIWVVCTDSVGNIKWQNVYGGVFAEGFDAKIIQLSNKNYVIGTSSGSNISGNKTENCRGDVDYWIVGIDSLGNKLWDKTFGGSKHDRFSSLIQISDDELLVMGVSNSPISGDKTGARLSTDTSTFSWAGRDIWLVKYNFTTNKIVWDKTIGGEQEEGWNVCAAFDGTDIYCLTSSLSGISGTKTVASYGSNDLWLNKLDTAGNVTMQKAYGGSGGDIAVSILLEPNGNLLLGSTSYSQISGTKTENSSLGDYWFTEIEKNGNILWDKTYGGDYDDELSSVYYIGTNHYLALGSSKSGISGDKTEPVRGNFPYPYMAQPDAWIIEMSTDVGIKAKSNYNMSLSIYPNPSAKEITIRAAGEQISVINVYSIIGDKIFTKEIDAEMARIDITSLTSGVYLIHGILKNGKSFTGKFIKE